jgi:hypothetical protein
MTHSVDAAKALIEHDRRVAKYDGKTVDESVETRSLAEAESVAALAQAEVDSGFFLLLSHAVVDIWGALECAVDDLLTAWIMHEPSVQNLEEIQQIRVPLALFQSLNDEEKAQMLLDELKRAKRTSFSRGVVGFEDLLSVFGLSGPLDDELRRVLIEVRQVRNCIVHRRGRVDRRFVETCPWLGHRTGDKLCITTADFEKYGSAIDRYVTELIYRDAEYYGVSRAEMDATRAALREGSDNC